MNMTVVDQRTARVTALKPRNASLRVFWVALVTVWLSANSAHAAEQSKVEDLGTGPDLNIDAYRACVTVALYAQQLARMRHAGMSFAAAKQYVARHGAPKREVLDGVLKKVYESSKAPMVTEFTNETGRTCVAKYQRAFPLFDLRPTAASCLLRYGTLLMPAVAAGKSDLVGAVKSRMRAALPLAKSFQQTPEAADLYKLIAAVDYDANEQAERTFASAIKAGDATRFDEARERLTGCEAHFRGDGAELGLK